MLVGLTGNSGTGASTVADFWRGAGCGVCHLDHAGHRLMEKARVRRSLGVSGLESMTGSEARRLVGSRAFTDAPLMERLRTTMHPVMARWARIAAGARRGSPGVWALEGALIYEMGLGGIFDIVVAVVDTPERAFLRIFQRDGVPLGPARWKHQLPIDEKAARADYVLRNSEGIDHLKNISLSLYDMISKMEVHRG